MVLEQRTEDEGERTLPTSSTKAEEAAKARGGRCDVQEQQECSHGSSRVRAVGRDRRGSQSGIGRPRSCRVFVLGRVLHRNKTNGI